MTEGIDLEKDQLDEEQCYTCDIAKSVQTVSRKPQLRAVHAFDEIYTDVVRPINPISKNGHKWAVIYTDNATRTRWIETFKYKREAYTHTITFVLYVRTQYNAKIKMIRLDGGTEYGGDKLIQFLKNHGIRLEPTVPYTPEQNGVAERSNRTIFEKLRCILFDSKAPKDLWPEFLRGIIHITNRIATAALDSKTPYEALAEDIDCQLNPNLPPMSYKPSVKHIRVLGCRATVHIQKGRRTISEKREPRAKEGILVGFEGTKIYKVWIPSQRGITRTSTIKFTEEEPLEELVEVDVVADPIAFDGLDQEAKESFDLFKSDSNSTESSDEVEVADSEVENAIQGSEVHLEALNDSRLYISKNRLDQSVRLDNSAIRRNPKRKAKKPSRYLNLSTALSSISDNLETFVKEMIANADPSSYNEAMEDKGNWQEAIESEIKALAKNDT